MKLQISFDMRDLKKATEIARNVAPFADSIEVGTVLLINHGLAAVTAFREAVGSTPLVADAKIIDRGNDCTESLIEAGADWITVMAGTSPAVINMVAQSADVGRKMVMLDLLDSCSLAQSALDAESLGVDALVYHKAHDDSDITPFFNKWNLVRENTKLPIYVSSEINRENIEQVCALKPDGIIVGTSIWDAEDPVAEAQFYRNSCSD